MPQIQVKKIVASSFLEAVKFAMEQMGARRLEATTIDRRGSAEFPRIYGEIRRLRDYLQRCVGAHHDVVGLDLTPPDAGLLVAAGRAAVHAIEQNLTARSVSADERQYQQKKLTILADWTVELAEKPLVELPLPTSTSAVGQAVRSLTHRLQQKLYGDVAQRQKIVAPGAGNLGVPDHNLAHGHSNMQGVLSFAEEIEAAPPPDSAVWPADSPAEPLAFVGSFMSAQPIEPTSAHGSTPSLYDPRKLRDPRLRSLAAVDMAAYERAVAAADYRLATILMVSLLESAVLDQVLPRRAELKLVGSPETWNPLELLVAELGGEAAPQDRSLAYHLFAARGLLRPSVQLLNPTIVTAASFDRLREFVLRALGVLGLGGSAPATLPPGSYHARDFAQEPGGATKI